VWMEGTEGINNGVREWGEESSPNYEGVMRVKWRRGGILVPRRRARRGVRPIQANERIRVALTGGSGFECWRKGDKGCAIGCRGV